MPKNEDVDKDFEKDRAKAIKEMEQQVKDAEAIRKNIAKDLKGMAKQA